MAIRTVGIIGAGKLGTALGRLTAAAGLATLITSRPSPVLEMVLGAVLPHAELVDLPELARRVDVVIVAVPATAVGELDLRDVRGTVIDATNPWEATGTARATASVAERVPHGTPVARTLNHISYEELIGSAREPGSEAPRRAIAVVADDARALDDASELVDALGFDPVPVPADRAELFRPDGRLFGAWLSADELARQVA